ncbi:MAG: phosphoribosylaminoimidazolesuccinocarboxamide synthase [Gemmatimonadales bacterium]|nr:MAG: phosphoribosylaminoimidazolesuccinocarboxamide synthase [Gemmatimonadales bacterium]
MAHGFAAPDTGLLPLDLVNRGKVREMYDAGDGLLLMVASDRVSAFDVVMEERIPRKGEVLTQLTAWWLGRLGAAAAYGPEGGVEGLRHHAVSADPDEIARRIPALADPALRPLWARRSLLVRRTRPLPVECVVRGYLSGSAWQEYRASGTLAGEPLPDGMREAEPLDPPLFSPATKAELGDHDENIAFEGVVERLGPDRAVELRRLSLGIYHLGRRTARQRGILLADTKFEFGEDEDGRIVLIDEVLTPDSSRYWPEEGYAPGTNPPSLDKQPVRDWLALQPGWDRTPPPPALPPEVVAATTARYLEIFRRLTGSELDDFVPPEFGGGS